MLFSHKHKIVKAIESMQLPEHLKEYATRGKLIRGCLFMEAYSNLGGTQDVTQVAAVLEVLHSGLLVHDDIMDQDDMRRGKPAIHVLMSREHGEHYGLSQAICIGDMAFFSCMKVLSKYPELMEVIADVMYVTGEGQFQDMAFSHQSLATLDVEHVRSMYAHKTGEYTIGLPLKCACILAKKQFVYADLVDDLGELFQVVDDYLGLYGDSAKTGKPTGGDLIEGKRTMLIMWLYNKLDATQKQKLEQSLGTHDVTWIVEAFKDHDLHTYVSSSKISLKSKVLSQLPGDNLDDLFVFLVNFLVSRDK